MILRDARSEDAAALAAVYAPHVLHGTASFEEVPPDAAEMAARYARVRAAGLPYLVAEVDGALAGYAYATPYNPRSGYRFTVENSVYVSVDHQGRGLGRALLEKVIEACTAQGLKRMVAIVGDSDNAASLALHRRLGFRPAGLLQGLGYKHGRWLDVVMLQLDLVPQAENRRPIIPQR